MDSSRGEEDSEAIVFESGDSTINVYRSRFAGTNKATALTWTVDDVEDVVRMLKGRGVKFEHYDLPDTRREGEVHVRDGRPTLQPAGARGTMKGWSSLPRF
jgi:hypothetical protein